MRKRGFALIVVLLVVAVIATMATAVVSIGSGGLDEALHQMQDQKAVYAARAGAQAALVQLAHDPSWSGFSPPTQTLPVSAGSYTVSVYPSGGPAPPNGVIVPSGLVYVLSKGTVRRASRTVGLMVKTGVGTQNFAVVAASSISLSGNSHIDSVDPLTGLTLPDPANIATNDTAAPSITLTGGSSVQGNASVGPGAPNSAFSIDNSGAAITGTQSTLGATIPLDPVVLPSDPTAAPPAGAHSGATNSISPGTYGTVSIDGGATLNLAPGQYVFDSLSLGGGGKLAISGATTIYIKGTVAVNVASIVNPSKEPTNLKFLVQGSVTTPSVTLSNGGVGYYVMYAPTSPVTVSGGSSLYGNLVGKSLTVSGGSSVHFDPASGGALISGGSTTDMVVSYQLF